jgi:Uma2 family endonuclease
MATAPPTTDWLTAADLLERLGGIAPERLRLRPPAGSATERDLIDIHEREGRLYELVDGVLVEKAMGFEESELAMWLGHLLLRFLEKNDLGILAGADGAIRLMPRLVRIPDVSFVSWQHFPDRQRRREPILGMAPDLAVEVLSPSNTAREMALKVREYFLAGVRLVWLVDPRKRCVYVYTAPDQRVRHTEDDTLDGGDVLPGLRLSVRKIFARTPRQPRRKNGHRR